MENRSYTREQRRRRALQRSVGYLIVLGLLTVGIIIGVSIGSASATDKVQVTYHVALDGTVRDKVELTK